MYTGTMIVYMHVLLAHPSPPLCVHVWLLFQRLDDTNPQVRDSAMEVLATLLKALGERAMTAYLENVDKTKMTKVLYNYMY